MDLYHRNAEEMPGPQLRAAMKKHLLGYICKNDLGYIAVGSSFCTIGCVLNHYICARGMSAMARVDYNGGTIFASILLTSITFFVAHLMIFRFLALAPDAEGIRIIAALVVTLGSCGMSYVGLDAREYRSASTEPPRSMNGLVVGKHDILYPLVIASMALAASIVVFLLSELRKITHKHLSKLKSNFEQTKRKSVFGGIGLPFTIGGFKWTSLKNRSWTVTRNLSVSSVPRDNHYQTSENVCEIVAFQQPSSSVLSATSTPPS